jgi:hypothetical protein
VRDAEVVEAFPSASLAGEVSFFVEETDSKSSRLRRSRRLAGKSQRLRMKEPDRRPSEEEVGRLRTIDGPTNEAFRLLAAPVVS